MDAKSRYWFPAKTYGWGWGLPSTWQGWLVLVGFQLLVLGAIPFIHPRAHPFAFMLYFAGVSTILAAICWRKGEPPQWRWGKK